MRQHVRREPIIGIIHVTQHTFARSFQPHQISVQHDQTRNLYARLKIEKQNLFSMKAFRKKILSSCKLLWDKNFWQTQWRRGKFRKSFRSRLVWVELEWTVENHFHIPSLIIVPPLSANRSRCLAEPKYFYLRSYIFSILFACWTSLSDVYSSDMNSQTHDL